MPLTRSVKYESWGGLMSRGECKECGWDEKGREGRDKHWLAPARRGFV